MIKCNLAAILAERNIKITHVADHMGISRTTLTALVYNTGKGVQFETMDKLCEYLDVTPGDLFTKLNVDVSVIDGTEIDTGRYRLTSSVKLGNEVHVIEAVYSLQLIKVDSKEDEININIELQRKFFNKISIIPQPTIESELAAEFFNFHYNKIKHNIIDGIINVNTTLIITD